MWLERTAGQAAGYSDAAYAEAGAELFDGDSAEAEGLWATADVLLTVQAPELGGVTLKPGALLLGLLDPFRNSGLMDQLESRQVSALALELLPRISRAQTMDALSSQANIAGYKAVLLAAAALDRFFPMLMTAAGTVQPAKVVVLGAGVAGLQAVATARRLGAIVSATDVRKATEEQVKSLGAKFVYADIADAATSGVTVEHIMLSSSPAANGDTVDFTIDYLLPLLAPNSLQGANSSITLTFHAAQSANQPLGDCQAGRQCNTITWG